MRVSALGLKTLGLRLKSADTAKLPTLTAKPGVVERKRGYAAVKQRKRIMEAHNWLCQACKANGLIRIAKEVDHTIPLEDGGSDDDSNQRPLCLECHKAKTAAEASMRSRR